MSIEPYSPDFHITYGLHSGYPICCVFHKEDNGGGGECPECKEAGRSYEMHRCHEDIPACQPYIELVTRGVVDTIKKRAKEGWGEICLPNLRFSSTIDRVTNALRDAGYVLDREETYGGTVLGVDDDAPPPKSYYVYKRVK